ncbi:MAG: hypothetical protein R3C24_02550 [Cyanobacteriota/Melainabacteria group bacterium]
MTTSSLAERLVFREPAQKLNIKVEAGEEELFRDKVTLAVKATDESGKPAATVGLNVTDEDSRALTIEKSATITGYGLS